jgi:hypothetical protein
MQNESNKLYNKVDMERMTSLQISEIISKPHNDLMKSIRSMEESWEKVNGKKFMLVYYVDSKGEKRPCYSLNKTETLYIATKFNDEARAKLVLRWEQLEKENLNKKMYGGFDIPKNYLEALKLAVSQQEKIIELEPKADYTDKVLLSPEKLTTTEVAKSFGMKSPQKLNGILVNLGVQYKTKHNYVLCSPYSDLGYVRVNTHITSDGEEKLVGTTYQLVWTEKGRNFLYDLLVKKGYLEKRKEDTSEVPTQQF